MTVTGLREGLGWHRAVRGWNLLRLESVRRRLGAAEDTLDRVGELYDTIAMAGDVADPVLVDPRFGRWCAEMTSLLDRRAPTLLPDGRFRAACRDAGGLTLAVRVLLVGDGAAAVPVTTVRVAPDGRVPLPGTGLSVVFDRAHAGVDARVAVGKGQSLVSAPGATVSAECSPLPGLASPDGDPVDAGLCADDDLLTAGPPAVVVERGTPEPGRPALAGIARVPAEACPQTRAWHVLAAAAQLRSVLAGSELFNPGTRPRAPAPEVMHLATAPQIVRLLHLYQAPDPPPEIGVALEDLARWLAASNGLSAAGRGILVRLEEFGVLPSAARAAPVDAAPAGRARTATRLVSAHAEVEAVLAGLGASEGIELNGLDDGRQRADPTIDHLSLLRSRDAQRYEAVVARLADPPRDTAEELLLAHRAYVEERFADAAEGYARLLLRHPDDIDLWRDVAFALRHLGAARLCETAMFRLPAVVARAVAVPATRWPCATTGGWTAAGSVAEPAALRAVAGLIEWVGHDSDHR